MNQKICNKKKNRYVFDIVISHISKAIHSKQSKYYINLHTYKFYPSHKKMVSPSGFAGKPNAMLQYDSVHRLISEIEKERERNLYIVRYTVGYLEYKDRILADIGCRDDLLYVFVMFYSEYRSQKGSTGGPIDDLANDMKYFKDHYEEIVFYETSCKYGIKALGDRSMDEIYRLFIHIVYMLKTYTVIYQDISLPEEGELADNVLKMIDDHYHYSQTSSIDGYLMKNIASYLGKRCPRKAISDRTSM